MLLNEANPFFHSERGSAKLPELEYNLRAIVIKAFPENYNRDDLLGKYGTVETSHDISFFEKHEIVCDLLVFVVLIT